MDSNLWPQVFCSGDRVTQIQVKGIGIKGTSPSELQPAFNALQFRVSDKPLQWKIAFFSQIV